VSVLVAAVVSLLVGWGAIRLAPRLGLVDRPDARLKTHGRPVAAVGGFGVFAGILAGGAVTGRLLPGPLLGLGALLGLGVLDDRAEIDPRLRLVAEVAIGAVLGWSSPFPADPATRALLGALVVVVAVNAVNLVDGLDGLAGSVTLVAALGVWWMASGRGTVGVEAAVLAGALAGFLALNRPPARVFLGDGGAYLVGGALAVAMLGAVPPGIDSWGTRLAGLAAAVALLGVVLVDLVVTTLRRRLAGRPLFVGDRSHLYDRLVDRGWPVPAVDLAAAGTQALVVAAVVGVDRARGPVSSTLTGIAVGVGLVGVAGAAGFLRGAPAPSGGGER